MTNTTPRLLSAEEIEYIVQCFYDKYSGKGLTASEIKELHIYEMWSDIAQAQQSLTAAEYQAEIAELKTENARVVQEVVDLVTEKRELQSSHQAKIKEIQHDIISWAGQLCLEHQGLRARHIDCVRCVQRKRKEIEHQYLQGK